MPKILAIAGLAVSVLMFLAFGLDAAVKFPFNQAAGMMVDIGFVVCSLILAYMSWNTLREQM